MPKNDDQQKDLNEKKEEQLSSAKTSTTAEKELSSDERKEMEFRRKSSQKGDGEAFSLDELGSDSKLWQRLCYPLDKAGRMGQVFREGDNPFEGDAEEKQKAMDKVRDLASSNRLFVRKAGTNNFQRVNSDGRGGYELGKEFENKGNRTVDPVLGTLLRMTSSYLKFFGIDKLPGFRKFSKFIEKHAERYRSFRKMKKTQKAERKAEEKAEKKRLKKLKKAIKAQKAKEKKLAAARKRMEDKRKELAELEKEYKDLGGKTNEKETPTVQQPGKEQALKDQQTPQAKQPENQVQNQVQQPQTEQVQNEKFQVVQDTQMEFLSDNAKAERQRNDEVLARQLQEQFNREQAEMQKQAQAPKPDEAANLNNAQQDNPELAGPGVKPAEPQPEQVKPTLQVNRPAEQEKVPDQQQKEKQERMEDAVDNWDKDIIERLIGYRSFNDLTYAYKNHDPKKPISATGLMVGCLGQGDSYSFKQDQREALTAVITDPNQRVNRDNLSSAGMGVRTGLSAFQEADKAMQGGNKEPMQNLLENAIKEITRVASNNPGDINRNAMLGRYVSEAMKIARDNQIDLNLSEEQLIQAKGLVEIHKVRDQGVKAHNALGKLEHVDLKDPTTKGHMKSFLAMKGMEFNLALDAKEEDPLNRSVTIKMMGSGLLDAEGCAKAAGRSKMIQGMSNEEAKKLVDGSDPIYAGKASKWAARAAVKMGAEKAAGLDEAAQLEIQPKEIEAPQNGLRLG